MVGFDSQPTNHQKWYETKFKEDKKLCVRELVSGWRICAERIMNQCGKNLWNGSA